MVSTVWRLYQNLTHPNLFSGTYKAPLYLYNGNFKVRQGSSGNYFVDTQLNITNNNLPFFDFGNEEILNIYIPNLPIIGDYNLNLTTQDITSQSNIKALYKMGIDFLKDKFNSGAKKEFAVTYQKNNNEPSIILKKDEFEVNDTEIQEKNWKSALIMQGQWNSQILHPETSDKEWLNLVKYSFISKVMTPVTSYLVVENEAQKAMLKKKQEQVLSGNKSLDLGEDAQRMSEPSLILLAILLGLAIWYREKRKRKLTE